MTLPETTSTSYSETLIRRTASMISRWHGKRAEMHELTAGHPSLRILLGNEVYGKNLLISCLEPLHICGPRQWDNSQIVVNLINLNPGKEGILVLDDSVGMRIVCETFEVRENVKTGSG